MGLLITIILLPLMGAALTLLTRPHNIRAIRFYASSTTFAALALTLLALGLYDRAAPGFQLQQRVPWVEALGIGFHVGVDGISLTLLLLTAIVGFAAVLLSADVPVRQKEFYVYLLLMETGLLGAFASLDVFFLYFFHELALIPAFLMVGIWGRDTQRGTKTFAAMKLTIYLSLGALIALIGLLLLYFQAGLRSFNLLDLQTANIAESAQVFIFPLLLVGFGILVSLWPFHTWAPIGYAAAPTATAMMHSGVLKKFGLYALIRIGLPLLPDGATAWVDLLMWLCVFNILYCGLTALAQRDIGYLIGYSSVMHMGYAFLGIASLSLLGLTGAVLLMFAHGISVALAFGLAGYLTNQARTHDLDELGGLAKKMPFVATAFTMTALASCGLPGFANFASEILIFFGAWQKYPWAVLAGVWGVVLSAVYLLRAARDAFFGPLNPRWSHLADARDAGEKFPFVLLLAVLLLVGCWPRSLTELITPSVAPIAARFVHVPPSDSLAKQP